MNWLNKVWKSVQRSQERRAAYWQLNNLSDRALKDMGMDRSEIRRVVYHGSEKQVKS